MCYGPYPSSKFQIFLCACLLTFFVNNFIMTGEPTHTASEMAPHAPAISILLLFENYAKRNSAACPNYINYRLKSEVSITLHC